MPIEREGFNVNEIENEKGFSSAGLANFKENGENKAEVVAAEEKIANDSDDLVELLEADKNEEEVVAEEEKAAVIWGG